MRTFPLILICCLTCTLIPRASQGQLPQREDLLQAAQKYPFRTWTDNTGIHQTSAKYLRHDQANVTLMKKNNLVLVLPFSRLSIADRDYVSGLGIAPLLADVPAQPTADTSPPADPVVVAAPSLPAPNSGINLVEMGTTKQLAIANQGLLQPFAKRDFRTVLENLDDLYKNGWPKDPMDELVMAVAEVAETGIFSVDEKALMLILKTDPNPHIAILERAVNRPDFILRRLGYQGLTAIKNERSLSVLMRKFDSDDDVFIGTLLPEFGSRSEVQLHAHLKHEKPEHILIACSVLGQIGTEKSVSILSELIQNTDKVAIRQQANTALNQIQARQAPNSRE